MFVRSEGGWSESHRSVFVVAVLSLLAFVLYLPYVLDGVQHFSSPDETQNYFFANLFRRTSELSYTEPLNAVSEGIIHPRGVGVLDNTSIVPGSFLGLPLLAGFIGKLFGELGLTLTTPLFAAGAVFAFFFFTRAFFSLRVALTSSFLLAVLPPFWIYALKGFWHNALFVSFVVLGFVPLVLTRRKFPDLFGILAGFSFGIALAIRTVEALWLVLLIAAVFILRRKTLHWRFLPWCILAALVAFLPVFLMQGELYGSALALGYSKELIDTSTLTAFFASIHAKFSLFLFPFGFDVLTSFARFVQYSIVLSFYSLFILLGMIIAFHSSFGRKVRAYTWFYLFGSVWLILYYGPLDISYEHLGRDVVNIGSSYFRFWLPIYVFGVPFIALAIVTLAKYLEKRFLAPLLLVTLLFISLKLVVFDEQYGLQKNVSDIRLQNSDRAALIQETEEDAVILAGVHDKVYFPERRVIGWDGSRSVFQLIRTFPALAARVPVYYAAPDELTRLSLNRALAEHDYTFGLIRTLPSGIPLYAVQEQTLIGADNLQSQ